MEPARQGTRPIERTIPLDEALALIDREVVGVEHIERIALHDATGRVLAHDVTAQNDVPAFDRAAMDGYAVIAEDTSGAGPQAPKVLRLVDRVFTGQVPRRPVGRGECIEIATGAPMPAGADAVVMVEKTQRDDVRVRMFAPVRSRQHVGCRAADIAAGRVVARRGDVLLPGRVGAIAAVGVADVDVFARPHVAILSTGNEVVDPGRPLAPGQVHDINRFTLAAIVHEHGGTVEAHPPVGDTLEDLRTAFDACRDEDLIVFSGGSSVGERDLLVDVLAEKGNVLFHGLAVKPGKPTAFGKVGGTPVLAMPGYPTSCLSNGYILLAPVLRRLAHLPPHVPRSVSLPLGRRVVSTTGRRQFYTVKIVDGTAMPAFKASGDITSMSEADGYFDIPANTDIVEEGQIVEVMLF